MAAPRQEPTDPTEPMNDMMEERRARISKNRQMLAQLGVPQLVSRLQAAQAAVTTQREADKGDKASGGSSSKAQATRAKSTRSSAVRAQQRLKEQAAADGTTGRKRKHAGAEDMSGSESSATEPSDDEDEEEEEEEDVEMEEEDEEGAGEGVEAEVGGSRARKGGASKSRGTPGKSSNRRGSGRQKVHSEDAVHSDAEEERQLQLAIAASLQGAVEGVAPATAGAASNEGNAEVQGQTTGGARSTGRGKGKAAAAGGRSAGAGGGRGGRGGGRGGKRGQAALSLTEADVLRLFEELRSEKRGVVTHKKLLAVTARLGLDYDEERVNQMLDFAASVVGNNDFWASADGAGPSNARQGDQSLNFERFQLLVSSLLGAQ